MATFISSPALAALALASGLTVAGTAHSGSRVTHADVQGTKLTVAEPGQLSETVTIRVRDPGPAREPAELLRRMQVMVEGLRGCRFDETTLRKSGRDYVAGFSTDCWFHRASTKRRSAGAG